MKRLLAAALTAALLLGPTPMTAWAQDDVTSQVVELSGQAAQAYRKGEYAEAIRLFQQAYELQAVPNLLFNIAKVYEKLEDWDNAAENYREFIKAPDADSKAREIAMERVAALEEIQRAEREEEERRLAEQREKEEAERERLAQKEEQSQTETQSSDEPNNTVAWITLGGGATLLAGGVVFGLLASSEQSKFEVGSTPEARRAARASGRTFAIVADSMFATGAVATVVGIILFATSGSSEADTSEQVALPTGWIGADGEAGFGLHWQF